MKQFFVQFKIMWKLPILNISPNGKRIKLAIQCLIMFPAYFTLPNMI